MAQDGKLLRHVDKETLYDVLMTYLAGRLYLRTKRGVHVNPFDRVPLYRRQSEETSDLIDMGQISISEEENIAFVQESASVIEDEQQTTDDEETDKNDTL